MTNKLKVLVHCDAPTAGTGFGTVARHVIGALNASGRYEIHQLGINFHGDFINQEEIPWQIQPARLLDPRDPHGLKMFIRALRKGDYDIAWVCNDLYVTHNMTKQVAELKTELISKGEKVPFFIYYYPVDCHVSEDLSDFLRICDLAVCYTKYGREETLKTMPELAKKIVEIPHGVDTSIFQPASDIQIAHWKKQFFDVEPETAVVLNVNRNSTRKQMAYSVACFKEFKKYVPNSIMYLHAAVNDQGGDLVRAIKDLGLSTSEDVVFPTNFSPANPISVRILNAIYNTADVFLTTHLGEGFGLTVIESMACGIPTVAPNNTCMPQLLGENEERGYLYPCKDTIWVDSSGFRKKGLIPDIVDKMLEAYKDRKKDNIKISNAIEWCKQYSWQNVVKQWLSLFLNVEDQIIQRSKISHVTEIEEL